jgi:hypothetical protein
MVNPVTSTGSIQAPSQRAGNATADQLTSFAQIINDEQRSVQEKTSAYAALTAIRQKWTGDFTTPEAQLADKALTESGFAKQTFAARKKLDDVFKHYHEANLEVKTLSSDVFAFQLRNIESFSADEQDMIAASGGYASAEDWKDQLKAQIGLSKIEEEGIAKNQYDPFKPDQPIKDPRLAMAVSLLKTQKTMNQTAEANKAWTQKAITFLEAQGLWNKRDPVKDRVDLSAAAKSYMKLQDK